MEKEKDVHQKLKELNDEINEIILKNNPLKNDDILKLHSLRFKIVELERTVFNWG